MRRGPPSPNLAAGTPLHDARVLPLDEVRYKGSGERPRYPVLTAAPGEAPGLGLLYLGRGRLQRRCPRAQPRTRRAPRARRATVGLAAGRLVRRARKLDGGRPGATAA